MGCPLKSINFKKLMGKNLYQLLFHPFQKLMDKELVDKSGGYIILKSEGKSKCERVMMMSL